MTNLSRLCLCGAFLLACWHLRKKHLAFVTVGLERKLQASADTVEQLSKDKAKLQNDMSDMMKESGDSSVQLTKMNQDLTEKERYLSDTLHQDSGSGQNGLNIVNVMTVF